MMLWSENNLAERLARLASRAAGNSFNDKGVAEEFEALLVEYGIDSSKLVTKDASGLSKENRVTIITDINSCAEPIDGWKNYNTYVANNLDLPKSNINKRLEGIVEFSFNVRLDGTIYNIQFYKSMGALYDEATKRMFMEGPKWKIKNINTQTVRVQVHF